MPDWNADSPLLTENLSRVLVGIKLRAERRRIPTLEDARAWQLRFLEGLDVPESRFVGAFRGEPGIENVRVRVGPNLGVEPPNVAEELWRFEERLQAFVAELDAMVPAGQEPDEDQLAAIIDLCAWAHSEWVRIHPFVNGNGRTARLWANSIAMRYGVPPFVRLRPRPEGGYGNACARAMRGDWKPTAAVFRRLLDDFLNED